MSPLCFVVHHPRWRRFSVGGCPGLVGTYRNHSHGLTVPADLTRRRHLRVTPLVHPVPSHPYWRMRDPLPDRTNDERSFSCLGNRGARNPRRTGWRMCRWYTGVVQWGTLCPRPLDHVDVTTRTTNGTYYLSWRTYNREPQVEIVGTSPQSRWGT